VFDRIPVEGLFKKLRNMDKLLLNSFRETDTMYKIWKGGFE
jgi:hypothetical protein